MCVHLRKYCSVVEISEAFLPISSNQSIICISFFLFHFLSFFPDHFFDCFFRFCFCPLLLSWSLTLFIGPPYFHNRKSLSAETLQRIRSLHFLRPPHKGFLWSISLPIEHSMSVPESWLYSWIMYWFTFAFIKNNSGTATLYRFSCHSNPFICAINSLLCLIRNMITYCTFPSHAGLLVFYRYFHLSMSDFLSIFDFMFYF